MGVRWTLGRLHAASPRRRRRLRNAMQRDLIGALGAVGAAQVRFLFGLPFAVLFLAGVLTATGVAAPPLTLGEPRLDGVRRARAGRRHGPDAGGDAPRSFVVVVAYTKTEPAQVALFALVVSQRDGRPLADRRDRPGDGRRRADGGAQPQGARERLAAERPMGRLGDLLRLRGGRLSRRR